MLNLPIDLFKFVASFLGLKDIASLALVSKQHYEMTQKLDDCKNLKSYIATERENLSSAQINYLLSDTIYSKLKSKQTTIEAAKAAFDQSQQKQGARINALRYPMAHLQLEEQKQQTLANNKGYLEEELTGLTPAQKKAVLEHSLSVEQARKLRHDQIKLITEKNFKYDDVIALKSHQTDLLKHGWSLEKAKTTSAIDARIIANKRKNITHPSGESDPPPLQKTTRNL